MAAKKEDHSYERGGVAFVGSILLGLGFGWLVSPEFIVQGALIGAGVGFILMALLRDRKAS